MPWFEANLDEDFQGIFAGGAVVLPKAVYVQVCKDLLASVPDFTYSCHGAGGGCVLQAGGVRILHRHALIEDFQNEDFQEDEAGIVTSTWVVKGTHTGVPCR